MSENGSLFERIKAQNQLSDGVIAALLPGIRDIYFPGTPTGEIQCGDMSSFSRGTNNDVAPDMDLIFLDMPKDESRGFKDWTTIGTLALTGKQEGITSLAELGQYDLNGVEVVRRSQSALDAHFGLPSGSTKFNWARSWEMFPGIVFNLSLIHPDFGEIAIDLNIVYETVQFGVEHDHRFKAYFNRVVDQFGPDVAAQFVKDIRKLKKYAKDNARDANGWIDRTKKLPGFIAEALFASKFPPYTFAELMEKIRTHEWQPGRVPTEHKVGDQYNQIIDAGFDSFDELLENMVCENMALTLGAWENLLSIANTDHAEG